MANIKSNLFEDFVFHKAFAIIGILIAGSFKRMFKHAVHCFALIGDTWANNESFFSLHTFWCIIKTAFFLSIAISYFVVTSLTILLIVSLVAFIFVILVTIFAVYQVVMGIMFGIVDAFAAYIHSLAKNTFGA